MKPIAIEWDGEEYVISESEAFEVGEAIEEIISLTEIGEMAKRPRFHKLAKCYSVMINFAGGHATPQDVHKVMMQQLKNGDAKSATILAMNAASALIEILMDGAPEGDGGDEKKEKPVS